MAKPTVMKDSPSIKFLITVIFLGSSFFIHAQKFGKVISAGGSSYDFARRSVTDVYGNLYIFGAYTDTINFADNSKTITLYGKGDYDYFLVKYDCQRKVSWARSMGSSQNDLAFFWGAGLVTDAKGNVYVSGAYQDKIEFETSSGYTNATLSSINGHDIFFAKYDASGKLIFTLNAGSKETDEPSTLKMDKDGNLILCGEFYDIIKFTDSKSKEASLTASGNRDFFIAKYNDAGEILWAKAYGDTADDVINGLSTDKKGNIYITGNYSNGTTKTTLGKYTIYNDGGMGAFVAKLNDTGAVIWAQGAGDYYDESGAAICTDDKGNVYVTGSYNGNAKFTSKNGVKKSLTSLGDMDVFTAKYDADGNLIWLQSTGGTEDEFPYQMFFKDNALYTVGAFLSSFTFGNTTMKSRGNFDIFMMKYDTAGKQSWASTAGGTGDDFGYDISTEENGSPIIAGFYSGNAVYGSGSFTSAGKRDMYVAENLLVYPVNIYMNGESAGSVQYACSGNKQNNEFSTDSVSGFSYQWFRNDTAISNNNSYKFSPSADGNYYVVITNCSSHTDTSKTVTLQKIQNISLLTAHNVNVCKGTTVKMEVIGCNKIKWFPADNLTAANTAATVSNTTQNITYHFTATNSVCNTSMTDSVKININPQPTAAFDTAWSGKKLTLTAKETYVTYTWSIDGSVVSSKTSAVMEVLYTDNKPHRITLTTTNTFGCSGSDSIDYKTITGIQHEKGLNFSVYPNPFANVINLKSTGADMYHYSIMDLSGRVLSAGETTMNAGINTEKLVEGIYFIRLQKGNETAVQKIIKTQSPE